jgi:hypothetical protein
MHCCRIYSTTTHVLYLPVGMVTYCAVYITVGRVPVPQHSCGHDFYTQAHSIVAVVVPTWAFAGSCDVRPYPRPLGERSTPTHNTVQLQLVSSSHVLARHRMQSDHRVHLLVMYLTSTQRCKRDSPFIHGDLGRRSRTLVVLNRTYTAIHGPESSRHGRDL